MEIAVPKNFTVSTGKLQACSLQLPTQVFYSEYYEILKVH